MDKGCSEEHLPLEWNRWLKAVVSKLHSNAVSLALGVACWLRGLLSIIFFMFICPYILVFFFLFFLSDHRKIMEPFWEEISFGDTIWITLQFSVWMSISPQLGHIILFCCLFCCKWCVPSLLFGQVDTAQFSMDRPEPDKRVTLVQCNTCLHSFPQSQWLSGSHQRWWSVCLCVCVFVA